MWSKHTKSLLVVVQLLGMLINLGHICCFFASSLMEGFWWNMVYNLSYWLKLTLFYYGQIDYWFPRFARKNLVQQDGHRCWNYTNGETLILWKVWYEGNKSKGSYFLWQVSFQAFFIFDHSWIFLSLCLK